MNSRVAALAVAGLVGLTAAGAVTASALQDTPRDATPTQDPIGDILRNTPSTPPATPAPEAAPSGDLAPSRPVVVTPVDPVVVAEVAAKEEETQDEVEEQEEAAAKPDEAPPPGRRQRRRVAIIQAIDKITAETMRFEVEVGGRPVRFNRTLIFSAKACEVSASDEQAEDAVAYMDISIQPRGVQDQEPRQVFRGWMFSSTPGVSGLQHPSYDAWVVGCKA